MYLLRLSTVGGAFSRGNSLAVEAHALPRPALCPALPAGGPQLATPTTCGHTGPPVGWPAMLSRGASKPFAIATAVVALGTAALFAMNCSSGSGRQDDHFGTDVAADYQPADGSVIKRLLDASQAPDVAADTAVKDATSDATGDHAVKSTDADEVGVDAPALGADAAAPGGDDAAHDGSAD